MAFAEKTIEADNLYKNGDRYIKDVKELNAMTSQLNKETTIPDNVIQQKEKTNTGGRLGLAIYTVAISVLAALFSILFKEPIHNLLYQKRLDDFGYNNLSATGWIVIYSILLVIYVGTIFVTIENGDDVPVSNKILHAVAIAFIPPFMVLGFPSGSDNTVFAISLTVGVVLSVKLLISQDVFIIHDTKPTESTTKFVKDYPNFVLLMSKLIDTHGTKVP